VSDSNKTPKAPPPDDFSKTTPNVNFTDQSSSDQNNDWAKTNYKMPRQPQPDEWGKTVTNIKPIETSGQDFDKTYFPGAKGAPPAPEWGMTEARIDVGGADFGTRPEDFGGSSSPGYEKTTPYFQLPEAERAKYQNLPPTPAERAAQDQKEKEEKGGIPGWFWVLAGLMVMFFFAIAVLGVVYFFIIRDTGYEATVKGAPPGSTVRVNGSPWGVTDSDGSIKLPILKDGETKKVEIIHPSYDCQTAEVRSQNGVITPDKGIVIARCSQKPVKQNETCTDFQPGDDDKAERCYNAALDALPDPFTPEDLVRALNILIINFDSGKFDVPPVRLAALQKGAGFIKKLNQTQPTVVLEVGGHTDTDGPPGPNQTLSENRANAVKAVLVKFGVPDSMLQTRGYGPSKPRADNNTERGKYLNRRIEYSVVKR
jgi:outer membrane protein OmpA-like peptidoglycan-associated protein